MKTKIGIPRGLFFYQYYPLWKTFFEELGAEIAVSGHTNRRILDMGVKSCVDEACLPVKVFFGHVLDLADKVDYLFIPRLTSVSRKEYICPKFGGLPDMVRHSLYGLPPIIDTEINLRKSGKNLLNAAMDVGSRLNCDKKAVRRALEKSLRAYREFREQVKKGALPPDIIDKRFPVLKKPSDRILNILVIGHVYNLYDNYINMDMLKKLRNNSVNLITVDMIDGCIIDEKAQTLNKKMFWYFGRKAMGTALHVLDRNDIDGVIYVMSFGCGVDSFISDLVEKKIRRKSDVPFIILTIDEHSGEAGFNTRLEAFLDMVRWRYRHEADVSSHG